MSSRRRRRRVCALLALLLLPLLAADCRGQQAESALRREIDEVLPRLEVLAGLEAREPVRFDRRSREALREYVTEQLAEELPPEELEGIAATYAALGLIPDTLDLRALLLELYTEQVMGYYDPEEERLYLVEGVPPEGLRTVLVHELVHALQDQHADLEALVARELGSDRQTAAQAALEGHAMLVMLVHMAEEQAGGPIDPGMLPDLRLQLRPMLESQNDQFPVFRAAPRIIRETLLFPYLGGAGFVQALWRERTVDGHRPAPLDSLLPFSTEQVLHPALFFEDGEPPLALELSHTPEGWSVLYENNLGELETRILLEEHLGQAPPEGPLGWAGDRYRMLEGPAGRALVWISVWDDAAAADAFADSYRRVLEARPARRGRVERLELDGAPAVVVVDADAAVDPASVPVPDVTAVREVER